jgi:hypothetical protein
MLALWISRLAVRVGKCSLIHTNMPGREAIAVASPLAYLDGEKPAHLPGAAPK